MKIKSGMSDQGRKKVAEMVGHLLADTYALYLKTQNFHWNVKGQLFFSLHLLFEKQYQEMAEALDELAERVQQLGFFVDASFSGFQERACVKESRKPLEAKKMIADLIEGNGAVIRCAREIASVAEDEKDQATVDLMAKRLRDHEKYSWMLRSHLE